jgi:hypothetical protein
MKYDFTISCSFIVSVDCVMLLFENKNMLWINFVLVTHTAVIAKFSFLF